MPYYSGRVHTVIYENPAQAFYILKIVLDDPTQATTTGMQDFSAPGLITVRGNIPGMPIRIGSWFGFEASWSTHKEYGKQLVISRAPIIKQQTWDAESAEKVLSANGVGERILQQVRGFYGDEDFLKSLGDQKKLEQAGCTAFVAQHIVQRWMVVQAYFKAMGFLNDLGLPPGKIRQVWSTFGDDAEQVLGSNPWELVRLEGITFQQADEIANRLGLDLATPKRLRGAIVHSCKNQRSFGHLYLTTGQLHAEVQALLPDVSTTSFAQALTECHREKLLVIDRDVRPGIKAVYDPWSHKLECETANLLESRVQTASFGDNVAAQLYIKRLGSVGLATEKVSQDPTATITQVVEAAVDEWGTSTHLVLSEAQRRGVINALSTPVSILTGLPGTGKTTCLVAVVTILKDMGVPFLLCAPTGIAAKNLGVRTGADASTIHRAFSAKGFSDSKRESTYSGVTGNSDGDIGGSEQDDEWGYGAPDNYYPAEVVVVDEASMLDQHLIYRLLSCTSPECRLVIVGDAAQLPSVGPGNVLRDLIGSKQFPVIGLTEIFRQKDTSGIVYAAHAIVAGSIPDVSSADFRLFQVQNDEKVADVVTQIATRLYTQRVNFQILSPRHAGAVGVTTLNDRLRDLLNPSGKGAQEINVGGSTIREDDRIMVIKNDYKLGVYNGDVGKVSRIDRKAKEVELKIFGAVDLKVSVPIKEVGNLIRLAYACTVHKAQGLEYDVIVMPVVDSFRHQLQRNLLYTAVTRAKKRVFLVGTATALGAAVVNDKEDQRNTLFKDRLLAWGGSQGVKKV